MSTPHTFWDCTNAISQVIQESRLDRWEDAFSGRWEQKNWRNVPGRFYGALTDTCLTGRQEAPDNVLYDEDGQEFVFRQPTSLLAVRGVMIAAYCDPFSGYAHDGNCHWTTERIRAWWRQKGELLDWIAKGLQSPFFVTHEGFAKQKQLDGLRDFQQYIDGQLFDYLRAYAFFLDQGRSPSGNESLPDL
jgi:hypothetical protein